ncbi:MAG: hypothetical protein SF162_09760 [bacterium]|nr:hypothetical protein [bacterium]
MLSPHLDYSNLTDLKNALLYVVDHHTDHRWLAEQHHTIIELVHKGVNFERTLPAVVQVMIALKDFVLTQPTYLQREWLRYAYALVSTVRAERCCDGTVEAALAHVVLIWGLHADHRVTGHELDTLHALISQNPCTLPQVLTAFLNVMETWLYRQNLHIETRWAETLLELCQLCQQYTERIDLEIRAYRLLAYLAYYAGDYPKARAHADCAIGLRSLSSLPHLAYQAGLVKVFTYRDEGRFKQAEAALRELDALIPDHKDPPGAALENAGVHFAQDNFERALACNQEALYYTLLMLPMLDPERALGLEACARYGIGLNALWLGRYAEAEAALLHAGTLFMQMQNPYYIANNEYTFALLAAHQHNRSLALGLLRKAYDLTQAITVQAWRERLQKQIRDTQARIERGALGPSLHARTG